MSTAIIQTNQTALQREQMEAIQVRVALNSNLWGMKDDDVWSYYRQMCGYLGIDAVSHPFDVITDPKQQSKKLYPNSICTAQLGEKRKYSYSEMRISINDDLVKLGFKVAHVAVTVTALDGRSLVAEAFVDLMSGWEGKPLAGNNLVNALKKAGTQCRRRGTLQMAGLAIPSDEIPTVKLGDIERAEGDAEGVIIEHPPASALMSAPVAVDTVEAEPEPIKTNSGKLRQQAKTPLGRIIIGKKEGLGMSDAEFLKLILDETELDAANIYEAADEITEAEQKLLVDELTARFEKK